MATQRGPGTPKRADPPLSTHVTPRQPEAVAELRRRVVDGPGHLDVAVRRRAFSGADIEPELRPYVDKVTNCAYQITDRDIAALREAGYREDQLFELTVAAALGAGMARLDAGLNVLDGAE